MNAQPMPAGAATESDLHATVDERNPWLGLVSFTEETRAFFFGRDEEVAELTRRVQRKLLTVLFGKSGLGKTSILRAGLVPRLREHGYCPVYVRIAYSRDTPEPAEQIKEAIRRAASASGQWTQVGVAAAGESLWEFLHHRDDVLRDVSGTTLTPLLIFDQFEELFTLAQSDDFGRARAARLVEELADLVENRPPKALEARIDEDEAAAERFDFARSDYRVLISLREDYLAPLESLKRVMPSLSQNRLRLAPMTGAQALEAVLRPGRGLVSEEVAAAIVRFVAGGSELANAEVEPSLLSLICRELNDTRLAQGRDEISLDLLAGSHESILTNFYERSLADQGAAVRRIIEDDLLTESGYRENLSEESLLRRLEAAGASPAALATLVTRRLLRIEERLDVRRVELTHDVLSGVVKASRDRRHERETREAAERVLAEQRARELAARHALRRARAVAIGCILLTALAASAAVLAYLGSERAHRAERSAQQSRALAEQARNHSEQLLGYLTDDFARELESFGQLQVLAQFSQRQINYFHALPPELRSTETVRNGALALVDHARALRYLGSIGSGARNIDEAIGLLEALRRGGDGSEATAVALGRAYTVRCLILVDEDEPGGPSACHRAAAILEPLADRPGAPSPTRRAYVGALTTAGWADPYGSNDKKPALQAVQETDRAMQIASELGARDLSNLELSAEYAEAGAWRLSALFNLGRYEEVLRDGKDVLAVANRVLEQRPWYRLTLHSKEITQAYMAVAAGGELNPQEEMGLSLQAKQTALALLRLDPNNAAMLNNLALIFQAVSETLWAQGRVNEAIDQQRKSLDPLAEASNGVDYLEQRADETARLGLWQAVTGDLTGAMSTAAGARSLVQLIRKQVPNGGIPLLSADLAPQRAQAEVAYQHGDFAGASRLAVKAIERLRSASPAGASQENRRAELLYRFSEVLGRAEYGLGDFAAAESAERAAREQHKLAPGFILVDQRQTAEISIWLAMSLARQGKFREALQEIGPAVRFEQNLLAHDHGDVWVPYELACALYAQSLAEPARRETLLRRAAALLNGLPPRLQKLHDVQQWRRWVLQPLQAV